jgi:DnaJ-class molecular chaperone
VKGWRLDRVAGAVDYCPRCNGDGFHWRSGNDCRQCGGTGNVRAAPFVKPVQLSVVPEQGSLLDERSTERTIPEQP